MRFGGTARVGGGKPGRAGGAAALRSVGGCIGGGRWKWCLVWVRGSGELDFSGVDRLELRVSEEFRLGELWTNLMGLKFGWKRGLTGWRSVRWFLALWMFLKLVWLWE